MSAAVLGNHALPPIIFTPQDRRARNVKGGNGECTGLREVLILPTQAAKRMSPLENMLFHEWKERPRKHSLLTENTLVKAMIDE